MISELVSKTNIPPLTKHVGRSSPWYESVFGVFVPGVDFLSLVSTLLLRNFMLLLFPDDLLLLVFLDGNLLNISINLM